MKLDRIQHLEELSIDDSNTAFFFCLELSKILSGQYTPAKMTVKYDGSPSIVFGYHPKNKHFFVGTKSVWNKSDPKIAYDYDMIQKYYGHDMDLVDKLNYCFTYLQKICPENKIFQGDLLFRKKDLTFTNTHVSFTPNLITYSTSLNSQVGRACVWAAIGIVVHTQYEGAHWEDLNASHDVEQHIFKDHIDVLRIDPTIYEFELNDTNYKFPLNTLRAAFNEYIPIWEENLLKEDICRYYNAVIREEYPYTDDAIMRETIFTLHLNSSKKKNDRAKTYARSIIDTLQRVFNRYETVMNIKHDMLSKLNIKTDFDHFINGVPTGPEGLIVTLGDTTVKLINRFEFSKLNFQKHRKNANVII